MVAAGLTGATPHMISASINALSRLVFEFKGEYQVSYIAVLSFPLIPQMTSPPPLSLSSLQPSQCFSPRRTGRSSSPL